MTALSSLITSARYDLRDTGSTEYTDAELIDYYNRAQIELYSVLQSLKSDWVHESDTSITLEEDGNSVDVPSDFATVRSIWIDDDRILQKDVDYIYYKRELISDEGQPDYFAIKAAEFIFERTADQDYSLTVYYNKKSTTLVTADTLPFSDEFNQPLRQAIVLQAKSRNEYDIMGDAAMHDYFMAAALAKVVSRNFTPKPYRINF